MKNFKYSTSIKKNVGHNGTTQDKIQVIVVTQEDTRLTNTNIYLLYIDWLLVLMEYLGYPKDTHCRIDW